MNVQNLQNNSTWLNGRKFLYEVNIEEYLTRNNINLDAKIDNADIIIVKTQVTALNKTNYLLISFIFQTLTK